METAQNQPGRFAVQLPGPVTGDPAPLRPRAALPAGRAGGRPRAGEVGSGVCGSLLGLQPPTQPVGPPGQVLCEVWRTTGFLRDLQSSMLGAFGGGGAGGGGKSFGTGTEISFEREVKTSPSLQFAT